jgi:hypothetical protein
MEHGYSGVNLGTMLCLARGFVTKVLDFAQETLFVLLGSLSREPLAKNTKTRFHHCAEWSKCFFGEKEYSFDFSNSVKPLANKSSILSFHQVLGEHDGHSATRL